MLPETLTRLAGSFGPQLANDVKAFAQILGDPSLQNQLKLTAMGIGRIREDFAAAKTEEQRLNIALNGIKTAGKTFKTLAGDAEGLFTGVSVPIQQLGKAGASIFVLSQNINKREIQAAKNRAAFGETIANMRREIFVPFKEAFMEVVYPLARDLIMGFTELVKPQIIRFRDFLVGFTEGLPKTTDGRLKFIAENLGGFVDKVRMVFFSVANVFIELKNRVQNIANALGAAYVDIELFRADPTAAARKLGENTIGQVGADLLRSSGLMTLFMGRENTELFDQGRESQSSERRERVAAARRIDINKGKIDLKTLDANLAQNFLVEQLAELAVQRNAQLEGLPEAIADANKPTEIMETSFQTLGDVMATIAAQNTDDNPLMEELLRAAQVTADNTTVRASALPANNGG